MDRREAIRTLGAAVAVPWVGEGGWELPETSPLRSARRLLTTKPPSFRSLTPDQVASVTALTELIIPETDTPGATTAGVPQFIDLIITEWFDSEESSRFLSGLDRLNTDARAAHGVDFVDLDLERQVTMLEVLDADLHQLLESSEGQSTLDPVAAPSEEVLDGPDPSHHFMYQLKRLTLTGYFTSEVGMSQELNYQIIPGRYDGCADRG